MFKLHTHIHMHTPTYKRTSLIWTSQIQAPLLSGQQNEQKKIN